MADPGNGSGYESEELISPYQRRREAEAERAAAAAATASSQARPARHTYGGARGPEQLAQRAAAEEERRRLEARVRTLAEQCWEATEAKELGSDWTDAPTDADLEAFQQEFVHRAQPRVWEGLLSNHQRAWRELVKTRGVRPNPLNDPVEQQMLAQKERLEEGFRAAQTRAQLPPPHDKRTRDGLRLTESEPKLTQQLVALYTQATDAVWRPYLACFRVDRADSHLVPEDDSAEELAIHREAVRNYFYTRDMLLDPERVRAAVRMGNRTDRRLARPRAPLGPGERRAAGASSSSSSSSAAATARPVAAAAEPVAAAAAAASVGSASVAQPASGVARSVGVHWPARPETKDREEALRIIARLSPDEQASRLAADTAALDEMLAKWWDGTGGELSQRYWLLGYDQGAQGRFGPRPDEWCALRTAATRKAFDTHARLRLMEMFATQPDAVRALLWQHKVAETKQFIEDAARAHKIASLDVLSDLGEGGRERWQRYVAGLSANFYRGGGGFDVTVCTPRKKDAPPLLTWLKKRDTETDPEALAAKDAAPKRRRAKPAATVAARDPDETVTDSEFDSEEDPADAKRLRPAPAAAVALATAMTVAQLRLGELAVVPLSARAAAVPASTHTTRAAELGLTAEVTTARSALYVGPWAWTAEEEALLRTLDVPRHHPIRVFNKPCQPQRDTQFFSNAAESYRFSGAAAQAVPLSAPLQALLQRVNERFADTYNGVLVNVYHGGADYISAHADDEKELGDSGVVMLVYGATRKFRVRDKVTNRIVRDVDLPSGTVAWMAGDFQREFKHEVPQELTRTGRRVSLTFRRHLAAAAAAVAPGPARMHVEVQQGSRAKVTVVKRKDGADVLLINDDDDE